MASTSKSASKIIQEVIFKSEIKDEPVDDKFSFSTECVPTETFSDGNSETICYSDVDIRNINMDVNRKEQKPSNFTSANNITDEIFLKSEIKEEPIDDCLLKPIEYINVTAIASLDNEINCENLKCKIDDEKEIDLNWKEKENKIKEETEFEMKNESLDESGLILIEISDYTMNASSDVDRSEISPEQSEISPEEPEISQEEPEMSPELPDVVIGHKMLHTGRKTYQCDDCKSCFSYKSYLHYHKRIHTGKTPYKCDFCNKSFICEDNLNVHKRTHTGERPYVCDVCEESFGDQSNFLKHLRIHTGEKKSQCDLCNLGFVQSNELKSHMLKHADEKPYYRCGVCSKRFDKLEFFNAHKLSHIKKKKYQCDVCNKSFNWKSYLIRHKSTHTGEKSYQCDLCDKGFTRLHNLNIHKLTHF